QIDALVDVVFLYLLLSGARRHLPSFPTRRSSDLVADADRGEVLLLAVDAERAEVALDRFPGAARVAYIQDFEVEVAGGAEPDAADRKSTRLNSSHVKISYAVFCLKKKTLEQSRCG